MQADLDELEKFDAMAERWWDPSGPVAPLHKLNPLRLAFIRDQLQMVRTHQGLGQSPPLRPLEGLSILDIGCGAGLASEPMARMGASVTGIDLAAANIDAARSHARAGNVPVDYRVASLEKIVDEGRTFDAATMLEVIEHVSDQQRFLDQATACLRPGGLLIGSTISKTFQAYLKAIVGAEYLLGWLAPGTHDWRRFVKPSKMARMMRRAGLQVRAMTGVSYEPSHDRFVLCQDPSVNYMIVARRFAQQMSNDHGDAARQALRSEKPNAEYQCQKWR